MPTGSVEVTSYANDTPDYFEMHDDDNSIFSWYAVPQSSLACDRKYITKVIKVTGSGPKTRNVNDGTQKIINFSLGWKENVEIYHYYDDGTITHSWTMDNTNAPKAMDYMRDCLKNGSAFVGICTETMSGRSIRIYKYMVTITIYYEWEIPGQCKYYTGSEWKPCLVKYFNGSTWVDCNMKYFNGSTWKDLTV